MPKSLMDWLAIAGLWVATAVLAIKTGDLPLVTGAPAFFSAAWWGYVPFALATLSGLVLLARAQRTMLDQQPMSRRAGISTLTPLAEHMVSKDIPLGIQRPTIGLENAVGIILQSKWASLHEADLDLCAQELRDKLAAGLLAAYGRPNRGAVIGPIPQRRWREMTIDLASRCAVKRRHPIFWDLQFDGDYVAEFWPRHWERT